MTYGATAAPDPAPRASAALAADCEKSNGWGTVITRLGRLELCPACQPDADREDRGGR